MAIAPKRKHSQARRDKRRSNVWKLEAPTLVKCPQCGELKVPHQVCGKCGYYKGQEIIKKEAFDHTGLIYGMGHAVYTLSDPRAVILIEYAKSLSI